MPLIIILKSDSPLSTWPINQYPF